jgi:hypothetical protein
MVLLFQRIFVVCHPSTDAPLRKTRRLLAIVHTAPVVSTICDAVVGTIVPSGDVVPPPLVGDVVAGVVGPTFIQELPVHRHQLLSMPST